MSNVHEKIDGKWADLLPNDDERDWRDLVRLGLFMRRMALDWTLSRRFKEDTWEHHPKHGSCIPEKDESEICI